jgi:4-amino-4-deoxychorismate lyase
MIVINGEHQSSVSYADRGLHYGDGLFETLEILNGQAVFLDRHLNRLSAGCERLLIPAPNPDLLTQEITELVQSCVHAVLKIIITRGVGGRGYKQPETITATRALSLHPFPKYPTRYKTQGVNVRFCNTKLGQNQRLAGVKHLNRLEQVLARAEWQDPDIQEGLMFDSDNNLIEGTMSNVFLVEDERLLTPQLDKCGVDGIIRNIIIEQATINGLSVAQLPINKARILAADEVFMTNSIIGLWPVKNLQNQFFQTGAITSQLSASLEAFKVKDLNNA